MWYGASGSRNCCTTPLHLRISVGKRSAKGGEPHESVGRDWTTQRAIGMITQLAEEMQDVTRVASSLQAWTDISRGVVRNGNVERVLGRRGSVSFKIVTRVVVSVFECVRIGGILTIEGSCTMSTRQAWNLQSIHTWENYALHFDLFVSTSHVFVNMTLPRTAAKQQRNADARRT